MKILHHIFVSLLFLSSQTVVAGEPNDEILWIKNEYEKIRSNLNDYQKIGYEFTGESSEGAGGLGYLTSSGEIKLIEVTYYGEMGKAYFEFYYSGGQVFFVFERDYAYNTHIMMTQERADEWYKEDGVMPEIFDPRKTKEEEWRYYFQNGALIGVIDPDGIVKSESSKASPVLEASASNYTRLNHQIQPTPKSGAAD